MDQLPVIQNIRNNIRSVIIGKDETINLLLTALLCSGHVLIEDMPEWGRPLWYLLWRPLWAVLSAGYSLRRMSCQRISPVLICSI